eukprot:SAG11_NODE_37490_length_256_cov_1.636943_1_plen_51_part_10
MQLTNRTWSARCQLKENCSAPAYSTPGYKILVRALHAQVIHYQRSQRYNLH